MIVKCQNLEKTYINGEIKQQVLKNINLEIKENDFISILGESGSGKSTLLKCLSGLIDFEGEVILLGHNLKQINNKTLSKIRNSEIGFVFQDFSLINNLTVLENVLVPARLINQNKKARAIDLLTRFGLASHMNKYPTMLSGGQQQRVALCRAVINNPKVIFADEPTGNLDQVNGIAVMELLKTLNEEENCCIILITHSQHCASYAKRQIHLIDGIINNE